MQKQRTAPIEGGIDLGTDPAKTPLVTLADGVRFDIAGVVTSRLGRKRLELSYPYEGVGSSLPIDAGGDYVEPTYSLNVANRTRGIALLYEQRIVDTPPQILDNPTFDEGVASPTGWTVTGNMAFATDSNGFRLARFTNDAGAPNTGTVKQTVAQMRNPDSAVANGLYIVEYTVVENGITVGEGLTIKVKAGFALADTTLEPTTANALGRFARVFSAAATVTGASEFIIEIACSGGGTNTIAIGEISVRPYAYNIPTIPQRLNVLYKATGVVSMNGKDSAGGPTGIITGDGSFNDQTTRAKFVTMSKRVIISDPSTRPKILRRLPADDQVLFKRVKYEIGPCGISYPQSYKDRAIVAYSTDANKRLPVGVYRFRVAFENKFGDTSSPSLVSSNVLIVQDEFATITMPPIPTELEWTITRWRVYVSYQAGWVNQSTFPYTLEVTGNEPSAFKFWKSFPITTTTAQYIGSEHSVAITDHPLMPNDRGVIPKLRDCLVVDNVLYGIPEPDAIKREMVDTEGDGTPMYYAANPYYSHGVLRNFPMVTYDFSTVKDFHVDPTYFFMSPPGEPQYASQWIRFASGDEVGIGLSQIGHAPVIFTNRGIVVYDPVEKALRRVVSEVGCLARDTIELTERGIRFMGTDGVPRLFNGATVEEITDEVGPIFTKEDFQGHYDRFDRTYANESSSASGPRKWLLSYPVAETVGEEVPSKIDLDPVPKRNMLVADTTRQGRARWAIDRKGYEQMLYAGREGRFMATDFDGVFYWIEEGIVDQNQEGTYDTEILFEWAPRWFGSGRMARFAAIQIELDTKGTAMNLRCTIDSATTIHQEFTITTSGRQEIRYNLPAWFKGLYMDTVFTQSVSTGGRPEIYDVRVDILPLGV